MLKFLEISKGAVAASYSCGYRYIGNEASYGGAVIISLHIESKTWLLST